MSVKYQKITGFHCDFHAEIIHFYAFYSKRKELRLLQKTSSFSHNVVVFFLGLNCLLM